MKIPSTVAWFPVVIAWSVLIFHPRPVCAQLPAPNPLIVPAPLPSPPAPLPPVGPQQGIPPLAVVPPPAGLATPVSALRTFNCSCFGPASPTHWMGRVTAPGYFAAQQTAVSTCLSYNENKQPQPPRVAGQSSGTGPASNTSIGTQLGALTGLVANQGAVASALSAGQQLPPTVTFFAAQQLRACSRCACN